MVKRIVILGCGGRGMGLTGEMQTHGLLGRRVEIVGGYDINLPYAEKCRDAAGLKFPLFDSPKRMLAETRPDGAMIASTDCTHLENFRHLLPYSIPVMVEKPLESTLAKGAEFVRLARSYQAPVLMAHNMRFAPILRRAKQMVDEGRIGTIHSFRFHNNVHYGSCYFRTWMRQRANVGSVLIEKGSHDLDILHMLTSSRTVKIYGRSKRAVYGGDKAEDLRCSRCPDENDCRDSLYNYSLNVAGVAPPWELRDEQKDLCVFSQAADIEDDYVCLLQLADGAHGTYVQTLYSPYSYKSRIYTLQGSLGILEIDLDEYEGTLAIYPRYGSQKEYTVERFDYHHRQHYNGDLFLLRHFCDVVDGKAAPECRVEDGYLAMAAAERGTLAADTGREQDVPGVEAEETGRPRGCNGGSHQ